MSSSKTFLVVDDSRQQRPTSPSSLTQAAFLAQRKKFQAMLTARYDISDAIYIAVSEQLAPLAVPFALRKGEALQRAGEPLNHVYWITRGVARSGFMTEQGIEVTLTFATEGCNATPYHDLLQASVGQPAHYFVVAESAVEGFQVDWRQAAVFRTDSPALQEYRLKLLEYMLKRQDRRTYTHMAASARSRLATFRADHPGLDERISQKVLASYLEVTPPYLCQLLRSEPAATAAPGSRTYGSGAR